MARSASTSCMKPNVRARATSLAYEVSAKSTVTDWLDLSNTGWSNTMENDRRKPS